VEPRRPDPSARRAVSALPTRVRHPRERLLNFAPRRISALIMRRNSGHLCCPDSEKPDGAYGIPDEILRQIGRDDRPRRAAATSSGPRADHRPAMTRRLNRQFFKSLNPPRPAVAPPHLPACSGALTSGSARLNIGMILARDFLTLGHYLSMSSWSVSNSAPWTAFLASAVRTPKKKKGGAFVGPRVARCWPSGPRGSRRRGEWSDS
jgi:hypothetical protein